MDAAAYRFEKKRKKPYLPWFDCESASKFGFRIKHHQFLIFFFPATEPLEISTKYIFFTSYFVLQMHQ
jgi:hypothetical protein